MTNTMKSLLALCLFCGAAAVSTAETPVRHTSFKPGEIWTDNNGVHINAHGGGILYDKGTYYWYGEQRWRGTPETAPRWACTAIPPGTCTTGRTRESP